MKIAMRQFADERDWQQFHSPKNLCMALSVECAELMEHMMWQTQAQTAEPDADTRQALAEEIADVQLYLVRLADQLGIDIGAAVTAKIAKNAEKYPADLVRGKSDKYTRYQ